MPGSWSSRQSRAVLRSPVGHQAVQPPEQFARESIDNLGQHERARGEQTLGVAPARDDPETLRLTGLLIQVLGLLGGEEWIRAAVDKQNGGRRDLADNLDGTVTIGYLPRDADPRQHPGGGQAPRQAPDEFRAPGSPPSLAGVFPLGRPTDR